MERLPVEQVSESTPAHHSARRSVNGTQSAVQSSDRSRYDAESWIEVSSQPSSSSLSSAADDAPSGLRIHHDSNTRRRRPPANTRGGLQMAQRSRSTGASSQEEYDESESEESDRVMTSSNEGIVNSPLQREWRPESLSSASSSHLGDAEDDDENVTTINVARGLAAPFQPQPNAFNRPPSQLIERPPISRQITAAYPYNSTSPSSRPTLRGPSQRYTYAGSQPTQHNPSNAISPSYQADQDAALRASLSTLLSCAAAARGLPKSGSVTNTNTLAPAQSSRIEPSSLRIVPESVALGGSPHANAIATSYVPASSSGTQPRSRSADKAKRASAATDSKDRRASKKRKSSSASGYGAVGGKETHAWGTSSSSLDDISPTLLTWVVSAGVVVLVGALSFSAGYTMGKEVGRAEAGLAGNVGCGREMALPRTSGGLRRALVRDGLSVM